MRWPLNHELKALGRLEFWQGVPHVHLFFFESYRILAQPRVIYYTFLTPCNFWRKRDLTTAQPRLDRSQWIRISAPVDRWSISLISRVAEFRNFHSHFFRLNFGGDENWKKVGSKKKRKMKSKWQEIEKFGSKSSRNKEFFALWPVIYFAQSEWAANWSETSSKTLLKPFHALLTLSPEKHQVLFFLDKVSFRAKKRTTFRKDNLLFFNV